MNTVLVALLVAFLVALVSGHVYEDGEINCIGANDEGRMYWDPTDPTRYWICPLGEDYGKRLSCPKGSVFHANEQKCIPTGAPIDCTKVKVFNVKYRDLDDATKYWTCEQGRSFAVREQCPTEHAFMEDSQKCVPWNEWKWTAPRTN